MVPALRKEVVRLFPIQGRPFSWSSLVPRQYQAPYFRAVAGSQEAEYGDTRNEQVSDASAQGELMSDIAFRLMMESGVLRHGDRGIRRGSDGVPLHSTRQVSDVLNYAVDVLLGQELLPGQQKTSNVIAHPAKPTPSHPPAARFSLDGMREWLGLHDQTKVSGPKVPPAQLLVTRLEAQIQELELSLRTEQTLGQTHREELTKLGAQVNRIDVLEAELAIERESSSQLVQWLQEAENELVWLRRQNIGTVEN